MEIKKIKISELKIAEYNPRKDLKPEDEEYQKIKTSISEYGYIVPIVVNKDMTVIGGHQRLKVLKDLGYTEIECVIVEYDKIKEKGCNITLNNENISGKWDFIKLEDLLTELKKEDDLDLEKITGFSEKEIERFLNDAEEIINDNQEIDVLNFNDNKFQCKCPKCGFVFDTNK